MADDQVWHAIDRLADHIVKLGPLMDHTVQRAGRGQPRASVVSQGPTVVHPDLQRLYDFLRTAPGLHGWEVSVYSPETREIFGSGQFKSVRRNGMSHRNISIRRTKNGNNYVLRILNPGVSRGLTFREKTDQGVRDQLDVYFPPIHADFAGHFGLSLGKEMQYTRNDGSVCKVDVEDGVKTHIDSDDGEEYELESVSSNESEHYSDDGAQEGEGSNEEDVRVKRRDKDSEEEEDGEEGEEEDEEDVDSDD
jgi:hypothetical protein